MDTREMTEPDDLLTTGVVARLLGVSRQHVVDLCDRGEVACVRVGSHRRIPSREVDRLTRSELTRGQEKSLWLHQALLVNLLSDPEGVIAKARANIDRWERVHRADGMTAGYLEEWRRILRAGVDDIAETATSTAVHACELRQNTPFAGVLSDETRMQVLRSFARHWEAEHRHERSHEHSRAHVAHRRQAVGA